ncbi:hypothetical protein V2J09_003101 [Rumex salicifolius]
MDHNSQAPPLHHQQPPHTGGIMLSSGTAYHHHHQLATNLSNASPHMISPNSPALLQKNPFPFNSVTTTPASKPVESLNSAYSGDGSSSLRPGSGGGGGFSIDPAKKKRGRPRKYSPDGGSNIALGLAPAPDSNAVVQGDHDETPHSENSSSKKHRGRPPGSGKRQLDALGNCGVGFTPHVIFVKAGEDIASKIMAFAQQGPRTVCVLSANGSICNVTLRQSTSTGGSVTYEGRFEIISLTGSFLLSENGGNQVRTGGLSVSLAGPDGRVVGGGVAGILVAATPVQIIVGSFIANGKKPKYMPSVPESRMLHFGAPSSALSPSQEEASSDSSEDNANAQPNHPQGLFNQSAQQIHNMQQTYSQMGWPNPGNAKMLHH